MPSTPDAAPVTVEDKQLRLTCLSCELTNERLLPYDMVAPDKCDHCGTSFRTAATPSDRARVDGEVTEEDRTGKLYDPLREVIIAAGGVASPGCSDFLLSHAPGEVSAIRAKLQAAEQRALAAEKRREAEDRQADQVIAGFLDEPANMHGLTSLDMVTVRAIVRKLAASEQRVRALVEGLRQMLMAPMERDLKWAGMSMKDIARALLPAADGGRGEG